MNYKIISHAFFLDFKIFFQKNALYKYNKLYRSNFFIRFQSITS